MKMCLDLQRTENKVGSNLDLEMTAVEPIFTDDALDHLVWSLIFGIRIGSVANAVDAAEVLVVPESVSSNKEIYKRSNYLML
jgi:hypothetical protein